jgi:hypothetical protein
MHAVMAVIPILTFQFDECRFNAPREATLDASSAVHIYVNAGAGHLRLEGKPGIRHARIRGTACASARNYLDQIKLTASRQGDNIVVSANEQDLKLRGRAYARLHIVIEVPENLAATIDHGMGELNLSGTGPLQVKDGAGNITIHGVNGRVSVEDESGGLRLVAVRGDATIKDTGGEIALTDVGGSVDIRDGAGLITLKGVTHDVQISDAAGDIEVDGVGGDFTVRTDTNGHIDWNSVRGAVRIPASQRPYARSKLWPFR